MVSLKQLRYLDAVARHGHFGRAASDCAVTQPALSMQIQEMERDLGVQLIERKANGLRLTQAGTEIARRGRRVLSEVRDITEFARRRSGAFSNPIRFGVIPTVAPYLLPALLPVLRARHPDFMLQLRETHTHHLLADLEDGALDVVFLALPAGGHGSLSELPLIRDRFLLAMPPDRKKPGRVRATADLFRDERLLLLEEGHCLREQAMEICRFHNVEVFGASSLTTIVQMVANGMGFTLLPQISIELESRHSNIALKRFAAPEPFRTLGLAWRTSCDRAEEFTALGRLIVEAIAPGRSAAALKV